MLYYGSDMAVQYKLEAAFVCPREAVEMRSDFRRVIEPRLMLEHRAASWNSKDIRAIARLAVSE